jgi:hypothetical protein
MLPKRTMVMDITVAITGLFKLMDERLILFYY